MKRGISGYKLLMGGGALALLVIAGFMTVQFLGGPSAASVSATPATAGNSGVCALNGVSPAYSVTFSAVDKDKPSGPVTPVYSGTVGTAQPNAQAGGTAITANLGDKYDVIGSNASTFSCHVTNTATGLGGGNCNLRSGDIGANVCNLGLIGGASVAYLNSNNQVSTNETIGASGTGYITARLSGNTTSAYTTGGTSSGFITNPNVNKFGVVLDLNPTAGSTCIATLDQSQMTATFAGAACAKRQYLYMGTAGYEVGFECTGNLDVYGQKDLVFRLPAVAGQNPACEINGRTLAYDMDYQTIGGVVQYVETPESQTGALLSNGQGLNLVLDIS